MILITGGAGFIGSNIAMRLNSAGIDDLLISDRLASSGKWRNLTHFVFSDYIDMETLLSSLDAMNIQAVIHMGARTDTMDQNAADIMRDNFSYTKTLWHWCTANKVPFIYASSASVYGDGSRGFSEHTDLNHSKALNPYALSKLAFDRWVAHQTSAPPRWAGLRFFNVYGPGEAHKGRMASVVFHAYNEVSRSGYISLFKSYKPAFRDGEQKRDFIYVKDVADIVYYLLESTHLKSGMYNVGTGEARTFNDLAASVLEALGTTTGTIQYVDMPAGLPNSYQYVTQADVRRLREAGYDKSFTSLNQGIKEYVDMIHCSEHA